MEEKPKSWGKDDLVGEKKIEVITEGWTLEMIINRNVAR